MRPPNITRVTWLVASSIGHEWNSLYLPSLWNLPRQRSMAAAGFTGIVKST